MRAVFQLVIWLSLIGFQFPSMVYADPEAEALVLLEKIERLVVVDRDEAIELLAGAETNGAIQASSSLNSYLVNLKGYIELTESNFPQAVSFFRTARKLARESGNLVQEAESYRREGTLLMLLTQYSEALALFDKSLQLHRAAGSPKTTISLDSIVNIYELLHQYDQQMEYGWLLLEEATKFENYGAIAIAHYSIGKAFLAREDIEQARYHFRQQRAANKKDPFAFTFLTFAGFASLDKQQNKFASALENIESAKSLIEDMDLIIALPSILQIESEIRLEMGEIALAIQLLNRAFFIASEVGAIHYQIATLEKLTQIYEKQGEIELAYETIKRHQILQQENQINTERQLLTINQSRLDLDTKNREIAQLKYDQQITQQKQANQVLLLSLTFAIIVILSFFTIRLRKQKVALREASAEIQRATNAKSDFLARMSHEIRTPLNAIIGLTKLSLRSSEDQRQATNLKQVEESSQTLLALINDILDFSKIEAGKMRLESTGFSLDEVIDSSIRMNAIRAGEKGLELIKFVGPDVPLKIEGDALRLQQVINNLLSNAVKFTGEGSVSIVVNRQYSEHDLLLQFEIKDTGRGLSSKQKASLFDSFSQADESITRKYGGTGLGLAISKQLVELMGGEIWVESVPSQGATFFFTIKARRSESPAFLNPQNSSSSISALVVDSNASASVIIEQTLRRMNIDVTLANDGMSGIEKIRLAEQQKRPFDLVLLDWQMSDIDGIEATSIIRQEIKNALPKIIVMTTEGSSAPHILEQYPDFDGCLQKPLNASALFDCVIDMLKEPSQITKPMVNSVSPSLDWQHVHILLAEDNALNRKVAIGYLKDTHAKISVAENGESAISVLQNDDSIDIILMDIQMPKMDGLTAAQKIRGELHLDLPIIAMTAHAIEEDIDKSIAAGMNAHIVKPIEPQLLLTTIQSLIE